MAAPDPQRRSVLFRLGVGSLALVLGEAAWATARFARAPLSYGPPLQRRLGRLSDYPPGALTYEEVEKSLASQLEVVANDWDEIEARLRRGGVLR